MRTPHLALISLAGCAGPQTGTGGEVQERLNEFVALARENGTTIVAGPFVAEYTDAGAPDATRDVDLEGGAEYVLVAATPENSGLIPDVTVADRMGNDIGLTMSSEDGIVGVAIEPEVSAAYTVEITVYSEGRGYLDRPVPYGYVILQGD
ncbi:hypothetical protein [Rubrivirga sp.]|uniref:hypothetical protein n=1 Tax=Rubrivirga sp. TaxID=1885344 RepID=UPI003C784CAB